MNFTALTGSVDSILKKKDNLDSVDDDKSFELSGGNGRPNATDEAPLSEKINDCPLTNAHVVERSSSSVRSRSIISTERAT